jgi:hypothetical protein
MRRRAAANSLLALLEPSTASRHAGGPTPGTRGQTTNNQYIPDAWGAARMGSPPPAVRWARPGQQGQASQQPDHQLRRRPQPERSPLTSVVNWRDWRHTRQLAFGHADEANMTGSLVFRHPQHLADAPLRTDPAMPPRQRSRPPLAARPSVGATLSTCAVAAQHGMQLAGLLSSAVPQPKRHTRSVITAVHSSSVWCLDTGRLESGHWQACCACLCALVALCI